MVIEVIEKEVTLMRKYAECSSCKHQGKLSAFRLIEPKDVPQQGGLIKREKLFDGTYRCPYCGTKDPRQWTEEVIEVVREQA